ncbi:MAG: hypothetical protein GXC73_18220 [Chitinophagaceae bacterium]|nr:hypothetical protein [Chitinophagaceae bacterium]
MKQLFFFITFCFIVQFLPAQTIKTVVAVRASTFQQAKVTLLTDSVFTTWVSVKSTAYDGYVNHVLYMNNFPADSNAMMSVKDLPVLNHTNLKKIEYADGTVFFFQKLQGCMANCYFLRRMLLENEKVLLTSFVSDDLTLLRNATKAKIPYSVFLQFKSGTNAGDTEQVTYIFKTFTNKSKNKLAKLFKDHPALKEKIQNETYANNIDGLLQLLEDFGKIE